MINAKKESIVFPKAYSSKNKAVKCANAIFVAEALTAGKKAI